MRLLITGAISFTGCAIVEALAGAGHEVIVTYRDRPRDATQEARMALVAASASERARVDVEVHGELERAIEYFRPTVVVHHAAWTAACGSLAYDHQRGWQLGVCVLDRVVPVLARVGARGLIVTGSSAEYTDADQPHRESEPCWPTLPYGLSKLSATLRAKQLAQQYAIAVRIPRIFMPVGPHDDPQKLVGAAFAALRGGTTLALSSGVQRRDITSTRDIGRGYVALLNDVVQRDGFDILNLCSGQGISLRELLHQLALEMSADPGVLQFGARPDRAGDTAVLVGDPSRAATVIGWKAQDWRVALQQWLSDAP